MAGFAKESKNALYIREVQETVAELGSDVGSEKSIFALSRISEGVSRISSAPDVYLQVAQQLLDKIGPRFLHASPPCRSDVWVMFERFFLHGNHSIAFRELCNALALNSDFGEVVAGILVVFVSKKTAGVRRLTEVLSRATHSDLVSSLLHLPSRVTNVLMRTSLTEYENNNLINEQEYFETLSEAIFHQSLTPDIERKSMLKDLIARMVIMKHSETLVQRFLDHENVEKLSQLMSLAPHRSIAPLSRALLTQRVESTRSEEELRETLCILLRQDPVARDACIHVLPFERPVFRRPKKSLKRLVHAVTQGCGAQVADDALMTASEIWSSEAFASSEDMSMQRQVTRIILYYLKYTAHKRKYASSISNSVMMVLVDGVHERLNANDIRIRRHGMVIGEAASRFCGDKKVLKFEREGSSSVRKIEKETIGDDMMEDGGDSDFSDLAEGVGRDAHSCKETKGKDSSEQGEQVQAEADVPKQYVSSAEDYSKEDALRARRKSRRRQRLIWPQSDRCEEWQQEDDWSSIESHSMTTSSEEGEDTLYSNRALEQDYVELRKKLSAPMSVPRLLGLLIEVNKSNGGTIVVDANVAAAALRTLASRAEANFTTNSTLRSAAVELCLEVVRIDADRYPDIDMPELVAARSEAFHRVVQMDIGACGSALVERVICGKMSDIRHRLEALGVLAKAVRSAHERVFFQRKDSGRKEGVEVKQITYVGEPTKLLKHSLDKWRGRQDKGVRTAVHIPAWDVDGIWRVYHTLASRLCEGGGASFVQIEERDIEVWAQGILTLATLGCYGGSGAQGAEMRFAVIEIAMRRVTRLKADSAVRRALALALSIVIGGMEDREVRAILVGGASDVIIFPDDDEVVDIGREAFEWLQRAAEGDADIGVRRFAMMTLRKWSQRVEAVLG
eukprot:TRINITY_DN55462_c0_g1_i1.p1 TRINITY_DN55462_c0_g1~~TRINITY_DN55462_c0_g1_i1.p1  ORF type:complete len:906 (-),score=116.86 TRINITY_DN55462_c0_g1_i1:5732-8449(-)